MYERGENGVQGGVKTSRDYERQLIGRVRSGDRSALSELVELHQDRLFGFIWRMVHHHHDAEEICQEAFLKALGSIDSFSSEYRFSTWLFTIAYRVCLNHLRRKRPIGTEVDFQLVPAQDDGVPSAAVESEDAARLKELVWSAVAQLTPPQRAALLLFYRHELSCHEISRILQLPVATVKSHLHRARSRLRELLEPVADRDLQEFRTRAGLAG